jgi:hypothetical protein
MCKKNLTKAELVAFEQLAAAAKKLRAAQRHAERRRLGVKVRNRRTTARQEGVQHAT